jgi:DNA-binding protein HU-beta
VGGVVARIVRHHKGFPAPVIVTTGNRPYGALQVVMDHTGTGGGDDVNKSQLVEELASRFEGNRKAASHALESVLDTITRTVAKGERVAITGFGVFEKAERPARYARNPRTGERVRVKKSSVPRFKPGQGLKEVVSGTRKLPKLALGVGAKTASTARGAAKTAAGTAASTAGAAAAGAVGAARKTTRPARGAAAGRAAAAEGSTTTRKRAASATVPAPTAAKRATRAGAASTGAAKRTAKTTSTGSAASGAAKKSASTGRTRASATSAAGTAAGATKGGTTKRAGARKRSTGASS